ncbi:hypothetical protein niasHT_005138 [Heterodera trifolii]|uniref:MYND-type domain-containing protein n=1 Tax=Heterodera trifolii TaxID=157864 RepID=A0ABD2M7T5_9BILA
MGHVTEMAIDKSAHQKKFVGTISVEPSVNAQRLRREQQQHQLLDGQNTGELIQQIFDELNAQHSSTGRILERNGRALFKIADHPGTETPCHLMDKMINQKDNFTLKELKNQTDEEKQLFQLINEDKIEEAEELVRSGKVRVNSLDNSGMNALDHACFKGKEALVEFLLENGSDSDNRAHSDGYTSLMFAALAGNGRICQLLLDAGANAHAQNNIGKTASELAAFVGQHECVSIISNYISLSDVDSILHPQGADSAVIYPPELAKFIQRLTRTHAFHPVKLTFDASENAAVWRHVKKTVFTLDTLFEKQLRSKKPNEVLSLKLWVVLNTFRELTKFVDYRLKRSADGDNSGDGQPNLALQFAKKLLQDEPTHRIRYNEERFVRQTLAAFPYKQSMLWQTLGRNISNVSFGEPPSAFVLLCQTLLGARFVQTANFCRTCAVPSAKKRCKDCKTFYCSVECQRFDWGVHKKCCEAIKQRNLDQNCTATNFEELNIS